MGSFLGMTPLYVMHIYIYPLSEPISIFGHIGSISTKKWQILCTSCTSPKKVNKKKDSPSGATYAQKNYLIQRIQSLVSHISWFFCVKSLPAASSLRYSSIFFGIFESESQNVCLKMEVVCCVFSVQPQKK